MANPADSTHLARFSNLIRAWVWRNSTGCCYTSPVPDASSPEPASSSFVAGCVLVRGRRLHPDGVTHILVAPATYPRPRLHPHGVVHILAASGFPCYIVDSPGHIIEFRDHIVEDSVTPSRAVEIPIAQARCMIPPVHDHKEFFCSRNN